MSERCDWKARLFATGPEILLALAVALVAPRWSRIGPGPVASEDEAAYLLLAEGIYDGHGYVSSWLPGSPPHALYPPGFAALIATAWRVFGKGLVTAQVVTLALSVLALVLAYALARRLSGRGAALAVTGVLVASPLVWRFSGPVLSEALAQVLILSTLLAGEIWRERGGAPKWAALSLLAALAGLSVRMANLTLLLALVVSAAWPDPKVCRRRRLGQGIGAVLVLATFLMAWRFWGRDAAPEESIGYAKAILSRDLHDLDQPAATLGDLVDRVKGSCRTYAEAYSDQLLHHFGKLGPGEWPARLLALGLVAWGAWRLFRRGRVLTVTWALGHTALVLIHPAFEGGRFVHPILPLLLLAAWEGVRGAGGKGWGGRLAAVAAIVSCASAARVSLATGEGRGGPGSDPVVRYLEVARDIRASSPEGAVVICRKPCILRLETGLTAVCYPFTRRVEAHAELIRRTHATWILVDELSATTTEFLVPSLERLPWRLRLVHEVGGTRAYRIENR